MFENTHGFKEALFVNGLDIDYCYKINGKGYRVVELEDVKINHLPGETQSFRFAGIEIKYGIASPWRYYMQARAIVWLIMKYRKSKEILRYAIKWGKVTKIGKESTEKYDEFGRAYFGPFLLGFTRWLYGEIKKQNLQKVLFFARDGWMMERAFQLIYRGDVEERYVYFSRKSIRQALLHQCKGYEESLKYVSAEKYISFGGLLEYYGFDEHERNEISKIYSVALKKDFDVAVLASNTQIKTIYDDLSEIIKKKSKEQDKLLFQYLSQNEISGKVGIVDIGWKGSMQYYLETYLESHNMDVSLVGFYVGILPKEILHGVTHGFLYDSSNLKLRKEVLCFAGGLERLFQSLEGSTYGYKEETGKIVPVLNAYEYADAPEIQKCIMELQNSALEFVAENKNCVDDNKKMAYKLVRFGTSPTLKDVKLFSPFYNTDGTREYYISQKAIYKYGLREFMHALSSSPWKNGFLKSAFKIPFPYYWIYRMMKK